jgi:hypothetical protein
MLKGGKVLMARRKHLIAREVLLFMIEVA